MDALRLVLGRPAMQYAHASAMVRAPTTTSPTSLAPDLRHEEISALVTGADNTLLITGTGRLYYTGSLQVFRPRDPSLVTIFTEIYVPAPVRAAVATVCCLVVITEDGHVYVRGDPADGRLGIGHYADGRPPSPAATPPPSPPPAGLRRYYPSMIPIPTLKRPRRPAPLPPSTYNGVPAPVSYLYSFQRLRLAEPMTSGRMGARCTLLLGESGCVYASGTNCPRFEEAPVHRTTFAPVCFPAAIQSLEVSNDANDATHMVFVTAAGELYLCGSNKYGKLGLWEEVVESPLTLIVFPEPVVAARVGEQHTVVLTEDGRLYGTGANSYGELTNLPTSNYDFHEIPVPADVWRETMPTQVGLLTGAHATLLVTPSTVYVAGHNSGGTLAQGADPSFHRDFAAVRFPGEIVLAAKSQHGLFIATRDKILYVSGSDEDGLLGTGRRTTYGYPTPHPSFEKACALVPGCDG